MKGKAEIQCKRKPIIDHESVKGNRFGGSFFAACKAIPLHSGQYLRYPSAGSKGCPLARPRLHVKGVSCNKNG